MSYHGGRLAPWFDAGPVKEFGEAAAGAGGKRLAELVRAKTPVDKGLLVASIEQTPTVVIVDAAGRTVYESGAHTELDYAPFVEHGTGLWGPHHAKYEIRPKKPDGWLHWVDAAGNDVFAKKVMHPGSPGAHMFLLGVAAAEAELDAIVAPHLALFAQRVERQNHSGLGGF